MLSLALHGLLLILSIGWIRQRGSQVQGQPLRRASVVLAEVVDNEVHFVERPEKDAEPDERDGDVPADIASPASAQAPDIVVDARDTELTAPLPDRPLDAGEMTQRTGRGSVGEPYVLTEADKEMIAKDRQLIRAREPVGDPVSLQVFGSGQLTGRSFVFVIDRSQSMGGAGLGVLMRARSELKRALANLQPHHRFQVIAYNSQSTVLQKRQLLPASPANIDQVPPFFDRLAAYGSTVHVEGLTTALMFKPDVVVLMTDGGHPGLNGSELKTLGLMAGNRNGTEGTQIHCLHFGSGGRRVGSGRFMVELATQNRGSYRYIDVDQWDP